MPTGNQRKKVSDRLVFRSNPGLQCVYEPHVATTGFVRNRSIVDNARFHEGSKYVYNIDLKDFFPSIDQARVWKCLQLKPLNLTEEFNFKIEDENDNFISKILFQGRSIVRANCFINSFNNSLCFSPLTYDSAHIF